MPAAQQDLGFGSIAAKPSWTQLKLVDFISSEGLTINHFSEFFLVSVYSHLSINIPLEFN